MEKELVAKEVAEQEFARFTQAMDLDVDPKGMDAEDRKSLDASRHKIVKAIQFGHATVDDKGQMVVTPKYGDNKDPITFYMPTGASLMAMDGEKKNHDVTKMFATMADMTRESKQRFAKLQNPDLKLCMAVAVLFLG